MRTQQAGGDAHVKEPSLEELLELQRRNEDKESGACVSLPLDDVLLGPGHVAWSFIEKLKEAEPKTAGAAETGSSESGG